MTTAPLSLDHIVRPSTLTDKKAPVLFMLHGYGSNEEDLFSFAAELPETLCIISVRAPYALPPQGFAWYAINFDEERGKWNNDEEATASVLKIVTFIKEACLHYHADQDNVSLLGFSQGTILSYAVALSYPEKIKNVIALSGYIHEPILADGYKKNDFSRLAIYASHGTIDQVIPLDWAKKAPVLLDSLGIEHVFEEYHVGHGVAPQNFYALKRWLENQLEN